MIFGTPYVWIRPGKYLFLAVVVCACVLLASCGGLLYDNLSICRLLFLGGGYSWWFDWLFLELWCWFSFVVCFRVMIVDWT